MENIAQPHNSLTLNRRNNQIHRNLTADKLLTYSARLWFIVATIGLFIFVYYVAMFYGASLLKGDLEHWNSFMAKGYIPGEIVHNIAFGLHVILAMIIIAGGPLQLIPTIRKHAPAFHRWNGRVFVASVVLVTSAGLYVQFTRVNYGDAINNVSFLVNALLIYWFSFTSVKHALTKNILQHQQWAMRLIVTSYAVWFYRIGLMFWMFVHQKPVGFSMETFTGPFLIFLGFAQYVIPLAVLESYFYAQRSDRSAVKHIVSGALALASIATAIGVFAASLMMWLPNT